MSATVPSNRPTTPKDDKFAWSADQIIITKADPKTTWVTTYVTATGSTALCQNTDDFMLFIMQDAGEADQTPQDFFEAFMAGPQAKVMPQEIKRGLQRLGLI